MVGTLRRATGDFTITFFWVFFACTLNALESIASGHLGIQPRATSVVMTSLVFLHILIFTLTGILGGACFNPTETVSFYVAGLGNDSLFSMAVRFPAQVVGAVGGAVSINELFPHVYQHLLDGPAMKVDVQTAAMAERFLTFVISFVVLLVFLKGPKSLLTQTWLVTVATTGVVLSGLEYRGSSLNPAHAYGWAYVSRQHNNMEHFYVYWVAPLTGSVLAASLVRRLFSPHPSTKKEKQA